MTRDNAPTVGAADAFGAGALPGCWYAALPVGLLATARRPVMGAGRLLEAWLDETGLPRVAPDLPWIVQDGYVWVCPIQAATALRPPEISVLRSYGHTHTQRTVLVNAAPHLVLENSLDFAHGPWVHPWTQPAWLLARLGLRGPMVVTYGPRPAGLGLEGRLGGRLVYEHTFVLPDKLRLVILPGTPLATEVNVFHVPEGPLRTRLEVLLSRRRLPWERSGIRFEPGSLAVHQQDVAILEPQQRALDSGVQLVEHHTEADGCTLLLRQVLAAAAAGRPLPEPPERTIRIRIA